MRKSAQICRGAKRGVLCDWRTPLQLQQTAHAYSISWALSPDLTASCARIRHDESTVHAKGGHQLPPRQ